MLTMALCFACYNRLQNWTEHNLGGGSRWERLILGVIALKMKSLLGLRVFDSQVD